MNNKEKAALQKEVVDSLPPHPHGRLLLAPRMGKTKLIIDLIKRDKPESVLWVTPSPELAEVDIPAEFAKWKAKRLFSRVTTVTWMSLHKVVGTYEWIVLDEEQFITMANADNFRTKQLTYRSIISMTGSATKKEEKQFIYDALQLKVLYEIPINEAVDIGLLSNYDIIVVKASLGFTKTYPAGNAKKRFMTTESRNYDYLSNQIKSSTPQNVKFRILNRMRAIKNSPSKQEVAEFLMEKLEGRKLFFSGSIAQAESLCEHTYHSKTDNEDLQSFMKGDVDTIAMVNAGGTGFTYKKLDHLVLVQADSNMNGLTSQKIARTLLKQKGYKATIWIVCLSCTQDEKWITSTLESFDETKINYIKFKDLKENLC